MEEKAPLILTVQLDEASFTYFNSLRRKHFPPERNYLAAHLTLFHHLPAGEPGIEKTLEEWSKIISSLPLEVTEVKSIGKGVVFKIDCPPLVALHKKLQELWQPWLTPQDKQKLWPHVTVQNKVPVAKARETLNLLQASFQPFTATGAGFNLWSYEGGPWKFLKGYSFVK